MSNFSEFKKSILARGEIDESTVVQLQNLVSEENGGMDKEKANWHHNIGMIRMFFKLSKKWELMVY